MGRAGAPGLVVVVVDLDGVGGEAEDVAAGEDDLAVGGVVGGVDAAAEGLLALRLDLCVRESRLVRGQSCSNLRDGMINGNKIGNRSGGIQVVYETQYRT